MTEFDIEKFSHCSSIFGETSQGHLNADTLGFVPGRSIIDIYAINSNSDSSLIGLILLILMLFISAIWFFAPDIIRGNINALAINPLKRKWEPGTNTAGLLINSLLYLNYIVVVPILLLLILKIIIPGYFNIVFSLNTLVLFIISILSYIVFRLIFVSATAWLYDTKAMGIAHNKLLNSLEKTLGLIILPLLFISIYAKSSFLIGIGGLLVVLFMLSRWVLTLALGLMITKFSWFHIIMYLCTLEIIPFLLVIKLMGNQVFSI